MDRLEEGAPFRDREEAGRRLAERLTEYREEHPVVLALPRGGVAVGYEVARALGAPLDVIVARKLGAPGQPEFGIGAIAPGGVRVLDEFAIYHLHISQAQLERVIAQETAEMERRERYYRGDRPPPEVRDRTVILVDDGLATGVTARAAIRSLRRQPPRRLVLAAPVCAPETAESLRAEADAVICVAAPSDFRAVGLWYEDFRQLSDEEVLRTLERARQALETETTSEPPSQEGGL